MKNYIILLFILLIIHDLNGQNGQFKYVDTEYELSDISYNGVRLDFIESIKDDGSALTEHFSNLETVAKVASTSWRFKQSELPGTISLGVDTFSYGYWARVNGFNWDFTNMNFKNSNSSITMGNLTVGIGDNISVLNPEYSVSEIRMMDENKHCVFIRLPKETTGIWIYFNDSTNLIYEINISRQIY